MNLTNINPFQKPKIPAIQIRYMAGKRNGKRTQIKSILKKLQAMRNEPELYSDAERIEITLAARHCQKLLSKWNPHHISETYDAID